MNITALVGLGLIAAVLSIILRQYKQEFGLYIPLIAGIIILTVIITAMRPALDTVNNLMTAAGMNNIYGQTLLKGLAVCYLTQLAADACKDAGETAIAGKIELAGKIAVVLLSLPLFNSLVELITGLIT
ncbi:MAG: stage III sporulation protein AC/AD protein family [Oscillospiraceae bacterium]|jgi:stage III sporulation protein AD|nr:stage III sporulation protein AC/AD protein family [Oscillospiraceae bacterium]